MFIQDNRSISIWKLHDINAWCNFSFFVTIPSLGSNRRILQGESTSCKKIHIPYHSDAIEQNGSDVRYHIFSSELDTSREHFVALHSAENTIKNWDT